MKSRLPNSVIAVVSHQGNVFISPKGDSGKGRTGRSLMDVLMQPAFPWYAILHA